MHYVACNILITVTEYSIFLLASNFMHAAVPLALEEQHFSLIFIHKNEFFCSFSLIVYGRTEVFELKSRLLIDCITVFQCMLNLWSLEIECIAVI